MTKFRPAVGPRLKWLLAAVFGLFALLVVNSVYLSSITFLEWKSGITLQGQFYLWNFLAHLVLGFAIIIPTIIFGALHWRNVSSRPNPRAIAAGIATFVASIVLLLTGVALGCAPVTLGVAADFSGAHGGRRAGRGGAPHRAAPAWPLLAAYCGGCHGAGCAARA